MMPAKREPRGKSGDLISASGSGARSYQDLLETNRRRSREEFEYELLDTGVFNDDRYFDVFVEYAKGDPNDILIRISVYNRGPEVATIHVLPTLWFRNT